MRPLIRLVDGTQLNFGHGETDVVSKELVYLENMSATGHKPPTFLYDTGLAQTK